jgi:phosphonoacetate hydrolase
MVRKDSHVLPSEETMVQSKTTIRVNGRSYRLPERPTVVICFDGCDPAYIEQGQRDGLLSNIAYFQQNGFFGFAHAVVPTFTNPNNVSIVTGAPTSVHGIAGNYYLDRATGEERMITDASLMRCGTILAAMSHAGVKTAVVTAKDKLRLMLSHDLDGIALSAENPENAVLRAPIDSVETLVVRAKPDRYSADLSIWVLDAGVRLLECGGATLLYLSLSDFVQHAYAPGEPEANAFNQKVDQRIGSLVAAGAVVGIVADHGMNDKCRPDGSPNIIFLEEELTKRFGLGCARVICPIADPFVRHHGALGAFVRVYARDRTAVPALMQATAGLPGIEIVTDAETAAREYSLPLDREGDFIVMSDADTVIGSRADEHDLSGLAGHRLRSHGGLHEQRVPFLVSHRLRPQYLAGKRDQLRNFDIFDAVLNGSA